MDTTTDSTEFYDRHWRAVPVPAGEVAEKVALFLDLIPPDTAEILDVGCGDGAITNALGRRFPITGVDRSPVALEHLEGPGICCSATDIPATDRSFDLVLSSELLEHLPRAALFEAAGEMSRIARRYILVSVPNRENLRSRYARCPACGLEFNAYLHHHSFNPELLDTLFPGFLRLALHECGPPDPYTVPALDRLRQTLGHKWFVPHAGFTCARCGAPIGPARQSPPRWLVSRAIGALNLACRFLRGKRSRPYWLVALYGRS